MARRIIGLDLGAYSVKLLRIETGKQVPKFEVINVAEEVLSPEEEDGPGLIERQKEALWKLHNAGILEAEAFATGFYAGDGQIRKMEVPFVEARKIEAILPGLLEAEVPFDVSDMIISWHRQEFAAAPADKSAEPQENTRIRVGFGKKPGIAATLQLLQTFNIDPRQMHLASAALFETVREYGLEAIVKKTDDQEEAISLSGAIVDLGHRTTNLCIFDQNGIVSVHTFYRGGQKLTEEIAKKLEISIAEATVLKHEKLNFLDHGSNDSVSLQLREIARAHYQDLSNQIARIFITNQSSGLSAVKAVAFAGGGAKTPGLEKLFQSIKDGGSEIVKLSSFLPSEIDPTSMLTAFSYASSLLHVHSKDSRFNFRKDEFVWRGELDFLRTKSVPLVLWGLTIICTLTIMWSAMSLVLEKENKGVEEQLKIACSGILGKPNIPAKKCLALMKEQIASHVDMGIPEFTASDVYLKMAEAMPPGLNIVVSEMDILDKRVRITAQSSDYEEFDKVTAILRKVPCFVKLETGRTEKTEKGVKYNLLFDLDCSVVAPTVAPTKAG